MRVSDAIASHHSPSFKLCFRLQLLHSTIVGVVVLHLLLVPGTAFVTGGARVNEQDLHPHSTELNHSLLTLGCAKLNILHDVCSSDVSLYKQSSEFIASCCFFCCPWHWFLPFSHGCDTHYPRRSVSRNITQNESRHSGPFTDSVSLSALFSSSEANMLPV